LLSVRRAGAVLAQNIKLLAQDSKPGVGCLLNLVAACCRPASVARFALRYCQRFRTGERLLLRRAPV